MALTGLAVLVVTLLEQDRTIVPSPAVFVVLRRESAEVGPSVCPKSIEPVLAALDHPSARRRALARARLRGLNWRHLTWLEQAQHTGGVERRLALAWVVRRLRDRRYEGGPVQSLDAALDSTANRAQTK
jgi:hypothetical protein